MPVAEIKKVEGLAGNDLRWWWCNNPHDSLEPSRTGGALDRIGELLGESPGIAAVPEKLARMLQLQSGSHALPPILIQGETGTGKGLLARVIHSHASYLRPRFRHLIAARSQEFGPSKSCAVNRESMT